MDAGFSRRELVQLARNGFEVGTMDAATRSAALAELSRIEAVLA